MGPPGGQKWPKIGVSHSVPTGRVIKYPPKCTPPGPPGPGGPPGVPPGTPPLGVPICHPPTVVPPRIFSDPPLSTGRAAPVHILRMSRPVLALLGLAIAGRIAMRNPRHRLTGDFDSRDVHHVYRLASLVTEHSYVTTPPVGYRSESRQGHHMEFSPQLTLTEEGRVPVALPASSSGGGLGNRAPGGHPSGAPWRGVLRGLPGTPRNPLSARSGGVRRAPRDPDPRGPKMAHFCPPAVQSRGGVGGLRPLT